jgi:hypothetical protein
MRCRVKILVFGLIANFSSWLMFKYSPAKVWPKTRSHAFGIVASAFVIKQQIPAQANLELSSNTISSPNFEVKQSAPSCSTT